MNPIGRTAKLAAMKRTCEYQQFEIGFVSTLMKEHDLTKDEAQHVLMYYMRSCVCIAGHDFELGCSEARAGIYIKDQARGLNGIPVWPTTRSIRELAAISAMKRTCEYQRYEIGFVSYLMQEHAMTKSDAKDELDMHVSEFGRELEGHLNFKQGRSDADELMSCH